MKFTTPCFIRKNTPELRAKLEDIGYIKMLVWTRETDICLKTSPMLEVVGTNDYAPKYYTFSSLQSKPDSLIDCGTNELLFLAIAALRDDSDTHQWFIDKENKWLQCQRKTIREFIDIAVIRGYEVSDLRKATIPELIEHFKAE